MQGFIVTFQQWPVHPIIDHFTVAIFVIAVIADFFGSFFSTRLWLRYSALSLMILAALLTWGSSATGEWAGHQVAKAVEAGGGPALIIFQRHKWLGDKILPWLITALALWRIGAQLVGFIARSRPFYLLVAIAAVVLMMYQGFIGGELVYGYGVGTSLYGAQPSAPSPEATGTPSGPATPMPTVYVPGASPTPTASATAGASGTPSAMSAPSAGAPSGAPATPSASPTAGSSPTPSSAPTAASL